MKRGITVAILLLIAILADAQTINKQKLSPYVRQLAYGIGSAVGQSTGFSDTNTAVYSATRNLPRYLIAFVKFNSTPEATLQANHCQPLSHFGNLYIARIPLDRLGALSLDQHVMRIEASRSCHVTMDTTRTVLDAMPVYTGIGLPQAYTGKGVVVGVMDIGFDLTHPTFYSRDLSRYRIMRMWDQLSPDTLLSTLPVGRDYTTQEELLTVQHPFDGKIQTHGTHTTGIAAGSGYNTAYEGMAPESDICLVANATLDDIELIDSAKIYKYTTAIDALGFKYIFDYAQSVNKPCVINFSEGSYSDLFGQDKLYFEYLDSLIGPGRIIVSSAGNRGLETTYLHKPTGVQSAGAFVESNNQKACIMMKSDQNFVMRLMAYGEQNDTLLLHTQQIIESPDSEYIDTLQVSGKQFIIHAASYPNAYDTLQCAYELSITASQNIGINMELSFEAIGTDADVQAYIYDSRFSTNTINKTLCAGEKTHNILSPSASPSVISVGANSYRTHFINYQGIDQVYDKGTNGQRGDYSSVGPTVNELTKPDVMAPGTNVISAYSSFYLENNPNAHDISSDVTHFDFQGRTYAWNGNSGTSMSSPVVAGAIALWLEANPTLTTTDILETFRHTCRHYNPTLTYPNNEYGYGEIDVYKGLLHILGLDKIETISSQQSTLSACLDDNSLHVTLPRPSDKAITLRLFNLQGICLHTFAIAAGNQNAVFQTGDLPQGIYALQVTGSRSGNGSSILNGSKLLRK